MRQDIWFMKSGVLPGFIDNHFFSKWPNVYHKVHAQIFVKETNIQRYEGKYQWWIKMAEYLCCLLPVSLFLCVSVYGVWLCVFVCGLCMCAFMFACMCTQAEDVRSFRFTSKAGITGSWQAILALTWFISIHNIDLKPSHLSRTLSNSLIIPVL